MLTPTPMSLSYCFEWGYTYSPIKFNYANSCQQKIEVHKKKKSQSCKHGWIRVYLDWIILHCNSNLDGQPIKNKPRLWKPLIYSPRMGIVMTQCKLSSFKHFVNKFQHWPTLLSPNKLRYQVVLIRNSINRTP